MLYQVVSLSIRPIRKGRTMRLKKIALAAAAGSLALAPVAVSAQESAYDDDGGSDIVNAGIIAAIAGIGMLVLLLTDDDDDDIAVSP